MAYNLGVFLLHWIFPKADSVYNRHVHGTAAATTTKMFCNRMQFFKRLSSMPKPCFFLTKKLPKSKLRPKINEHYLMTKKSSQTKIYQLNWLDKHFIGQRNSLPQIFVWQTKHSLHKKNLAPKIWIFSNVNMFIYIFFFNKR